MLSSYSQYINDDLINFLTSFLI